MLRIVPENTEQMLQKLKHAYKQAGEYELAEGTSFDISEIFDTWHSFQGETVLLPEPFTQLRTAYMSTGRLYQIGAALDVLPAIDYGEKLHAQFLEAFVKWPPLEIDEGSPVGALVPFDSVIFSNGVYLMMCKKHLRY